MSEDPAGNRIAPLVADTSLELNGQQFREMVEQALGFLEPFLDSVGERPYWQPELDTEFGLDACQPILDELPKSTTSVKELLRLIFEDKIEQAFNTTGPGFMAFVPGGGIPHAAVADLVANVINRYVGIAKAAPHLVAIEASVIRWFCNFVGYKRESGGVLTTGGSTATLIAMFVARQAETCTDFSKLTVYGSNQVHYSVTKAAQLTGIPAENNRTLPTNLRFQLDGEQLSQQIEADLSKGLRPLAIVGNAGTVNTGAVDDLNALANIAAKYQTWFHVDGAYGGFFCLTPQGKAALGGIERADSITLDPHKGLFQPYGNGCLLVKDDQLLKKAFVGEADYLPSESTIEAVPDFAWRSPELTRDFRGLRIWLPIMMHTIEPFRTNLQEKLDLAQWIYSALEDEQQTLKQPWTLELIAPQLSTVGFRLLKTETTCDEQNKINQRLIDQINRSREVHLTTTKIDQQIYIRICIVSFRTHLAQVERLAQLTASAIQEITTDFR